MRFFEGLYFQSALFFYSIWDRLYRGKISDTYKSLQSPDYSLYFTEGKRHFQEGRMILAEYNLARSFVFNHWSQGFLDEQVAMETCAMLGEIRSLDSSKRGYARLHFKRLAECRFPYWRVRGYMGLANLASVGNWDSGADMFLSLAQKEMEAESVSDPVLKKEISDLEKRLKS